MRRLFLAAALVAFAAVGAAAQEETPKAEVFGGYAYGGSGSHGWDGSVAFNANRWFGIVADFGGQYTSIDTPDSSERIRTHTFLFGPRFSLRRNKHVTPFAHILYGAVHADSRARIGARPALQLHHYHRGGRRRPRREAEPARRPARLPDRLPPLEPLQRDAEQRPHRLRPRPPPRRQVGEFKKD